MENNSNQTNLTGQNLESNINFKTIIGRLRGRRSARIFDRTDRQG